MAFRKQLFCYSELRPVLELTLESGRFDFMPVLERGIDSDGISFESLIGSLFIFIYFRGGKFFFLSFFFKPFLCDNDHL